MFLLAKWNLAVLVLMFTLNSQAFESFAFEGKSAAAPDQPCRIEYLIVDGVLEIQRVEGVGYNHNVLSYEQMENPDYEPEQARVQLKRQDLHIFGDPEIQDGTFYGQRARLTQWDYGFRSRVYMGTSTDFRQPKNLVFDAGVRLFGVRSVSRFSLKCIDLQPAK